MNFKEQIQYLISRNEVKDASTNILEDLLNAILGNPISAAKVLIAITESPFFVREQLFWSKMEAFLDGVYINENDRGKLRAKLVTQGENNDNPYRLIDCIDRAETQQKIRYIINATRCLLTDFIDLPTFFRICHAITHTLDEDLVFLRNHIKETDLPYSQFTQGLLTSGLMYQSVIDGNGEQKYSFTPIAQIVDQYAISYNDVERYPNPTINSNQRTVPQISIPSTEWKSIPYKDIDQLF